MTEGVIAMPGITAVHSTGHSESEFMKPIINHLVQLQELIEARAQQETIMPNAQLSQLDASIKSMMGNLPSDLQQQFVKLQKKVHVAIVPVAAGVCSGCGMALPVSLVHTVKAAESIYNCPNCARLLYALPESSPRRVAKAKRRSDPVAVGIARFSSPNLMVANMTSTTRDDVIAELCSKLEEEDFVDKSDQLIDEALRREAIASTAVDHGLAFPHVRGVEGGGLALALGTSKKGIKYSGSSRALTRIVFFVVIPTAASAFYLKLLAGITQAFRKKESRDKLMAATTSAKLWKALVSTTKTTVR